MLNEGVSEFVVLLKFVVDSADGARVTEGVDCDGQLLLIRKAFEVFDDECRDKRFHTPRSFDLLLEVPVFRHTGA